MSKFIPVLAYHSFDPVRFPKNKLAIKPRLFRCQMERIRSWGYRGITIAECARGNGSRFREGGRVDL